MMARHKLYTAKQTDETLKVFMQRILSIATDGLDKFDSESMQQLATESFLHGCANKEAAALVMISGADNIQQACKKIKMIISSKKAVEASKVSFQERHFTAEEEKRISDLERKVNEMSYNIRSRSPQNDHYYGYQQDRRFSDQYSNTDRPFNSGNRYRPSPTRSSSNFRDSYRNPDYRGDQFGDGRRPSRSPSVESRSSSRERGSPSRNNSSRRYSSPGSDRYRDQY